MTTSAHHQHLFDRRALLVGGAGLLLAACGTSGTTKTGSTSPTTAGAAGPVLPASSYQLVQFFKAGSVPAGIAHRLAFGLGDTNGVLQAGGPNTLDVTILDADGKEIVAEAPSTRHANQLQRPYWPVTVNLPAGTYQAKFTMGGDVIGSPAFFAVTADSSLPKTGDKLRVVATPTPANIQGVTPICTRTPACPLHDTSLDTVLGRKPVALLIGTPAYCQTAICGPTLDVLVNNRREGITYIHAEVWKDNTFAEAAPLLTALDIDFEPILLTIRADGTIAERLDVIFDADDISAALAKIV